MDKDERFMKELAEVRPVTRNLIEAIMLDIWPHASAIVDFGIDSQKHYEALYYAIQEGEIMPKALDEAAGHGERLTALVRQAASNPHADVQFHTSWDDIFSLSRMTGGVPEAEKVNQVLDGKLPSHDPMPTWDATELLKTILDDKSSPEPSASTQQDKSIER